MRHHRRRRRRRRKRRGSRRPTSEEEDVQGAPWQHARRKVPCGRVRFQEVGARRGASFATGMDARHAASCVSAGGRAGTQKRCGHEGAQLGSRPNVGDVVFGPGGVAADDAPASPRYRARLPTVRAVGLGETDVRLDTTRRPYTRRSRRRPRAIRRVGVPRPYTA